MKKQDAELYRDNECAQSLSRLRRKFGFDFAGMASVIRGERTLLVWREASGNRNKNYLKIVLEPGKGIAGGVFRSRKAMVVLDTPLQYNESEIVHSPILLAEDLRSFAAFPLWKDDEVDGVLLLAMRREGGFLASGYARLLEYLADGFCGMEVRPEPYEEALQEVKKQEYEPLPIYELVDVPVRTAIREERHRIARDLHDNVIQNLLGVQMQLRTLKYAATMEEIWEGLRFADTSLSGIQKELREILVSVKPDIVEDLGLRAAFCRRFRFLESSYPIEIDFRQNINDRRFGTQVETVVYRIGQEAVANSCKYAGAGKVTVSLFLEEQILTLEISDSGKGFDAENLQIAGGGMGLPGMHYWAGSIGASLTVRSAPGKGTSVRLSVPVGTD